MPFDVLCKKVTNEAFDPDVYRKLDGRTFFNFDEAAYDSGQEETQLVGNRSGLSNESLSDTVKAEVRFGWMCGMDRDRIVQRPTNYSEILRNNCVLKKDVFARLQEAYNNISGKPQ